MRATDKDGRWKQLNHDISKGLKMQENIGTDYIA